VFFLVPNTFLVALALALWWMKVWWCFIYDVMKLIFCFHLHAPLGWVTSISHLQCFFVKADYIGMDILVLHGLYPTIWPSLLTGKQPQPFNLLWIWTWNSHANKRCYGPHPLFTNLNPLTCIKLRRRIHILLPRPKMLSLENWKLKIACPTLPTSKEIYKSNYIHLKLL